MADMVNQPPHYTAFRAECIEILEDKGIAIPFCLGNAFKYLWRSGLKWDDVEDLKKARWYLDRAIGLMEKQNESTQGSDSNV
jgi:hypothetical protein